MKIYVVSGKVVKEENLLSLRDNYWATKKKKIKIYDVSNLTEEDLSDFQTALRKQLDRDNKLKIIMNDGEYDNLINFIKLYSENCKDSDQKIRVLNNFKRIGANNINFKKYLSHKRAYFLLRVSNDVEYLKSYLKIHNAILNFTRYNSETKTYESIVSEETSANFLLAKKSIQMDRKNN